MSTLLRWTAAAGAMFIASTAPLLASHRPTTVSVPEIDATTGVLAIAAVLAVLAFVWERRRRAI